MTLHEITPYHIYQLLAQLHRLGNPLVTVVTEQRVRYRYYELQIEVSGLKYHDAEGAHWDWDIRDLTRPDHERGFSRAQLRELYEHLRACLASPPAPRFTFNDTPIDDTTNEEAE